MSKTKIEWCDGVWNPVWGCRRGCSFGCYAERFHKRFARKLGITTPFNKPTLVLKNLKRKFPKKPQRIFIGSMSDICYWHDFWMLDTIKIIKNYPQHTFMFLTKDPSLVYEKFAFPKNCWLGVTQTHGYVTVNSHMQHINFISIEPLLGPIEIGFSARRFCDWLIVGGLTPKPVHEKRWVNKIVKQARENNIPIFLKNNLNYLKKIQEFPK